MFVFHTVRSGYPVMRCQNLAFLNTWMPDRQKLDLKGPPGQYIYDYIATIYRQIFFGKSKFLNLKTCF